MLDLGLSATDLAAFTVAVNRIDPPKTDVFAALGYEPTPKQRLFHEATEFAVLFGGSLGGGKLLRIDEPIPTPSGWTTMGDLRVGDQVFTERGVPCAVLGAYEVDPNPTVYRLTFDDGTTIEAGADHEWLTFDAIELGQLTRRDPEWRARRQARRPSRAAGRRSEAFVAAVTERNKKLRPATLPVPSGTVRTTKQIAATVRPASGYGKANHAVPVAGALQLPEVDLPIDPYVMGAWLGDGHSVMAGFTSADAEIIEQLRSAGLTVRYCGTPERPYAYWIGERVWTERANGRPGWVNTWSAALRTLGVLGNKHIPATYLRASVDQRVALLQGLMDTDGTVNKTGQIEFSTTNPQLATGMRELIVSLGWKVRMRERRATLRGKDCGPQWVFKWSADRIVFRLPRKAELQKTAVRRTTRFRYIIECDEIESTPMRCITVDNQTSLYLAGRSMVPTHNTKALTVDVIKACVQYPGLRVGAFRRTYGELKESLLAELAQLSYANALGARWIGNEYELRFPNGSVAMFRYAESLNDATRRQGGQYQLLAFDELTLTLPEVVSFLESRLRSGRADVPVLGIRASANPGGPGHGSVRKRFIDSTNYGRKVILDERRRTVRFIPSRMEDNPHLNPEYEQDLLALPEVMRQALRDGNWDVFAGAMFPDLSHDRHVIGPVELPASWRRYNGVDWGYTKPWAVLWAAVDEDGRVWIYRELYKAGVGEAEQARMILAAEADGEHLAARFADDAMWATRGDAKPIADVYAENGVHLTEAGKGPGSRIAGWQRVHTYLADGPACPHHRALGWATCPRLHIFPQVTELYRELRDLPHATKGDPEDADTTASDHAADALRYLLLNVGSEPRFHFPPDQTAAVTKVDPQATGPRPPQPLPQTIGGFPVLNGSSPWG